MSTVFVSSTRRTYIPQSDSPLDSTFAEWERNPTILRALDADYMDELASCVAAMRNTPIHADADNLRAFGEALAAELRWRESNATPTDIGR